MWRLATGALVVAVGLTAVPARCATFSVNAAADAVDATPGDGACATATGTCSLRAAVQEANALPGADVISVPAGTFVLSLLGAGEDLAATGDLDVAQPLTINGAGRESTIVDGASADRVFEVGAGNAFTLAHLTVRNGVVPALGGAVSHAGGAALALDDVAFRRNVALQGGAVVMTDGALTITSCVFEDNLASGPGGAVVHAPVTASMDVRDSTFTRNGTAGAPGGALLYQGGGTASVSGSTFSANRGAPAGAVLLISSAATVTLSNSVIEDSQAMAASPAGGGLLQGDMVVLRDTTVRRCTAEDDFGGLLMIGAHGVTVTGSRFEDNRVLGAGSYGGAGLIVTAGTAAIEDTVFSGNSVALGSGGGFLVTSGGDARLMGVTLEGNSAGMVGGGGFISASTGVTIAESRIVGNTATSAGGGIFATSGTALSMVDTTVDRNSMANGVAAGAYLTASTSLLIERDTFSNNVALGAGAVGGGAFLSSGTTLDVRNTTVSGNMASGNAGGLFVAATVPTIEASTFVGNESSGVGAAVFSGATVTYRTTVMAATGTASCGGAAPASAGDNLDQDGSCALAGPGDRSAIDPQLGPLQDNGGPTFTHEPLPTSLLVDGVTAGSCLSVDQRGVARPTDGNGDGSATCDVGAVELVDECPSDPAKRLAGVCGCGVPDVDANANGAVDCLINAELKARIARARTVLTSRSSAPEDAQAALRTELGTLGDGILEYCTTNETTIVLATADAKLVKLAKKARKALRAARKGKGGALAKKQHRGTATLNALDDAVAPQT